MSNLYPAPRTSLSQHPSVSALAYTSISVMAAASLFLVATLAGEYTLVERFGDAGWVIFANRDYSNAPCYTASEEKTGEEINVKTFGPN